MGSMQFLNNVMKQQAHLTSGGMQVMRMLQVMRRVKQASIVHGSVRSEIEIMTASTIIGESK